MAKRWISSGLLVLTAVIWGAAFVAQSAGMAYVGPLTFLACRSLLGFLTLLPAVLVLRRRRPLADSRRSLLLAGGLCGALLFAATALQQYGLVYTTAGKSGFLTALYVVLVPVFSRFLGRRVGLSTWIGVALAAAALYLLCVDGAMTVGPGELLTLACAVFLALHILVIDRFVGRVDGVALSCLQFAVCALLALPGALLTEAPSLSAVARCWLPIGYAGVLSGGVAYTLQILGQKHTRPAVASLLLSLESVFAALFGALLLHERLTPQEYVGCALMFAAIVLAQLPSGKPAAAR